MSSVTEFQFIHIPSNAAEPITKVTADTAGGLTNDALVKHAKDYFFKLTGAAARVEQIDQASPEERTSMAADIRKKLSSSAQAAEKVKTLTDDAVLEMIHNSQSQVACDITALTVPMKGNSFRGVSMYVAQDGAAHGLPDNKRATDLVVACGHAVQALVSGDVFVGRYHDDEDADIWMREDFTVQDAEAGAEWCRAARQRGGGGGSGKAAASSLANLVQQTQQQQGGAGGAGGSNMQVMDMAAGDAPVDSGFGANGAPPVKESWGTWTQTNDEVELKFTVAKGTKAKYCKVNFGRQNVKVAVAGQVLLTGSTFDPIVLDEATYTLQDEGETKELCITLVKTEERTWAWTVRQAS